jgi:polysaccharide deacetylase family protein (PEP-CTERM system associated)
MNKTPSSYLFSIDLEDIRLRMNDGHVYKERVPVMIEKYLNFLNTHHAKATFFVVGDMAEKYPDLIRSIEGEGHEIGCHSYRHFTIDTQSPEEFKRDTENCINALRQAGVKNIYGYRAPVFSLIEKTRWAYPILKSLGFTYSSSVLPASNPLFGWPGFGRDPKQIDGILEIPMSIQEFGIRAVPFGGGVYFRILPGILLKYIFRNYYKKHDVVMGYFHPYDIDEEQEKFMHPGVNESKVFNYLMYYNRGSVFKKLEDLMSLGLSMTTHIEYIKKRNLSSEIQSIKN